MLEVRGLRTALIGPIDVAVAPGECVAVRGPSGSGKSLLLRAIADLDPNEGAARLGARAREAMPAWRWRRLVALVPAESGWWADSVAEHFDPADDAAAALAEVGLPDALDWEVARLSTGERQRLALARALSRGPEALMLDEPTSALDADAMRRVEAVIARRRDAGMPVILVTHDDDQAGRLASRTLRMSAGRLEGGAP